MPKHVVFLLGLLVYTLGIAQSCSGEDADETVAAKPMDAASPLQSDLVVSEDDFEEVSTADEAVLEYEAPLNDVWPALAEPVLGHLDAMLDRGEIRVPTTFTLGSYCIDKG